jgi:ubiquinone/menaquinone biosynthesis C-methylase UbiE
MARANHQCVAWVLKLLEVQPNHNVLEVGFGPGVGIGLLTELASAGHVAGVDSSIEMVDQAKARNGKRIKSGRVDLQYGSNVQFEAYMFDGALAISSMQVWPDTAAGLREKTQGLEGEWKSCWQLQHD